MLFIKKNVYESHFSKLSPSPRFSHVFHNQYILNTENKNSPSLSAEENKIFVDYSSENLFLLHLRWTKRIFCFKKFDGKIPLSLLKDWNYPTLRGILQYVAKWWDNLYKIFKTERGQQKKAVPAALLVL